ncbi:TetR family transcriptional regulator [Bacillus mycoides]|uniref:TetR family transcriptional regulator n=3 Tax=Bacillus cereus group TaxID=86661 RepID=A0A1D3MPC7_BACMY|nr:MULTISPECIES: TetR/AcrR family transcriptional regulator [Bacillus cereus group]MBJ8072514.1 TetR/AcrR family transcriptional regulator [Bacillus cereus]MBJ8189331.1 TetR/AcrR family transcriptional regulator [Bacillus cereus]MDR4902419.1 TetR/AcrR family transcriptional regulator [Bacillus mycoides]MED1014151.1 TetR/AcrR family transcriptional regulator [Bacillus mycoides]MED1019256.1 TetR/AcrR family transcriptional regulator [Bacillus mycoides]
MNQKRVIEVAATLFLEKGFAYTSMDELVRVSKVSKSNVYYHFSNKEVLLEGVVDYWIGMYQSAIDDVLSQNQFLVEDRIQLFLKQLSQGVQSREYKGSCPFITLYIQSPTQATQIKEKIGLFFTELQKKVSLLLKQGLENGEFRNTINIDEVASLFITNLEGALFISETLKDATVITKTADHLFNLLR